MGEPDTRLHASHRTHENSCLNLRKPSRGQHEITVQGHVRDKLESSPSGIPLARFSAGVRKMFVVQNAVNVADIQSTFKMFTVDQIRLCSKSHDSVR